jgi:hypothetical protein
MRSRSCAGVGHIGPIIVSREPARIDGIEGHVVAVARCAAADFNRVIDEGEQRALPLARAKPRS